MRAERVVRHQLARDLGRETEIEAAAYIDVAQLFMLGVVVVAQRDAFHVEIGAFDIGLRTDRYVLAGAHRQRARNEPGNPGNQDCRCTRMRRRDAEHQSRDRQHAIVRAKHGRAHPA